MMTCLPTNKVVFFATSNIHKYVEACQVLNEYKIVTAMLKKIDAVEIQDDSLENIAKSSAIDAVRKCRLPIIVEDAGLFIEALNGFPGPYSSDRTPQSDSRSICSCNPSAAPPKDACRSFGIPVH